MSNELWAIIQNENPKENLKPEDIRAIRAIRVQKQSHRYNS
mgnify:CR=1 FL=1